MGIPSTSLAKVRLFLGCFKFQNTSLPPKLVQVEVDSENIEQFKDRVSELPNDLFAIIFSQFQLKEIACNSVVSHRWRNLWKLATRLDLDGFKNTETSEVSETNKVKYVEWVNNIIESNESGDLQEIRIHYELDKHFKHDVDKWVKFAFSKQVQSFSLGLALQHGYILTRELVENFVNKEFNGFMFLRELSFNNIIISDELVGLILNNSPVLEGLCIQTGNFGLLSSFSVSGPRCVLKRLQLKGNLKVLEISDVANLVSLSYSGSLPDKLIINNVPSLVHFRFAGRMVEAFFDLKLNDLLAQFSSSLKSLTLSCSHILSLENYNFLPEMTALEKLVVETFDQHSYTSMYACLTEMYPSLREFVFQAHFIDIVSLPDAKIMVMKGPPHKCIKEVKILGYYGCARDVEIALYFLRNAVSLETLVIDPRDQPNSIYMRPPDTKLERDVRIRAKKQLKAKVPSKVKLVIL